LLSTTGPNHHVLVSSDRVGDSRKIGKAGGFREGQVHTCFSTDGDISYSFNMCFSKIQIGRIEDNLFGKKLDWWLVTGVAT